MLPAFLMSRSLQTRVQEPRKYDPHQHGEQLLVLAHFLHGGYFPVGFTHWCFIIFCAAGVRTLPLVLTDHGSAAAVLAAAAAAAEEAANVAGSAAVAETAAVAMATEAGAMVAVVVASSTSSTPGNFFFK
jgi:hypothetical protein